MTKLVSFLLVTALSTLSLQSVAGDAEITLKAGFLKSSSDRMTSFRDLNSGPSLQEMMRKLQPKTSRTTRSPSSGAANFFKAASSDSLAYEVTDCTGSNGTPQVCCSYTPGGGGSTCDLFMALCDQMEGTTSTGNSNGAVCAGEGTVE